MLVEFIFESHNNYRTQMKKSLGVIRNKLQFLQSARNELVRRKNIFKFIGKEEQLSENDTHNNSNHLLSATTKNSVNSDQPDNNAISEIYEEAKGHLLQVAENKKKMAAQIKLRMASFKESQIKIYDENITKYSGKAVDVRRPAYSTCLKVSVSWQLLKLLRAMVNYSINSTEICKNLLLLIFDKLVKLQDHNKKSILIVQEPMRQELLIQRFNSNKKIEKE